MSSILNDWEKFCDELKASGKLITENSDNEVHQLEGFRYLLRLLRLSTEMYFEHSSVNHPSFYCLSHETGKIGADNPDNHYLNANINSEMNYRIYGDVGDVAYLSFGLKENRYSIDGTMISHDEIELDNMVTDENNSFELILSKENNDYKNFLKLADTSNMLIVRQTYKDKTTDKRANINIELLEPSDQLELISRQQFNQYLNASMGFVKGTVETFNKWVAIFMKDHMNALPLGDQSYFQAAGGDPEIQYHHGYYSFAEDECLVIKAKVPKCSYWNFQLENHWMESLDYRHHKIHLNNFSAELEHEQLVIHVTHSPKDLKNNLITCGHSSGAMLLRWVGAKESITPETKLIKLDELNDEN